MSAPVTFHKDVYLPDHLAIQVDQLFRNLRLRYGPHAIRASFDDRFGVVDHYELPNTPKALRIIEVETVDGVPVKAVMQKTMRDGRRLSLVIQDNGFVRTVWTNRANDVHRTLDRSRYAQPTVDNTPKAAR